MKTVVLLTALSLALLASTQNPSGDEGNCDEGAVRVRVKDLTVAGPHQLPQASVDELRHRLREQQVCAGGEAALEKPKELAQRLRFLWQQHGYFKAVVWPVRLEWRRNGETLELEAAFRVEEGAQLTFVGIRWHGVVAFPEEELTAHFPIYPGGVFDIEAVRKGLEGIRRVYAEHGYLNMTAMLETALDASSETLFLDIHVKEGQRFVFGEIEVLGVEPHTRLAVLAEYAPLRGSLLVGARLNEFLRGLEPRLPGTLSGRLFYRQSLQPAEQHMCIDFREDPTPPCFAALPD